MAEQTKSTPPQPNKQTMPAYHRRERVIFLEDITKDAFGRELGGFPVGPNSEQKWPIKGDTGIVSTWSSNGWLKVRLDRHGAIVNMRAGSSIAVDGPPEPMRQKAFGPDNPAPPVEVDVRTLPGFSMSDGY